MLKRRRGIGEERAPTRKEYANVIPITDSRYEEAGMEERALASLEAKMGKRVEKAVDRFLKSPEIEDLTKFNDLILRMFLKVPARIRATTESRTFFDKIRRTANDTMAKRRRENTDPAKTGQINARSHEMARLLFTLESSTRQIANFVSLQSKTHPERVFATGINIDTRYGIDLVGADVEFNKETGGLDVDLVLYQSKASQTHVSDEDVRGLVRRYRSQKEAIHEELELDVDWIKKNLLTNKQEAGVEIEEEQAFEILAGEMEELAEVEKKLGDLDARDRFLAEVRIFNILKMVAEEFEVELPEYIQQPKINLRNIDFRYLVDTKTGTQDLSEQEAESFAA